MKMKKMFVGIFTGIAAGTIIGLIFAPAKGFLTRRKLARKGKEAVGDVKQALAGVSDTIQDEIDSVKKETIGVFVKGAKKVAAIVKSKLS